MRIGAHRYRVRVLASLKAAAWLAAPAAFFVWLKLKVGGPSTGLARLLIEGVNSLPDLLKDAALACLGLIPQSLLPNGIEDGITEAELSTYFLTPVFWSLVVAGVAALLYSTAVKWQWDVWDRARKYLEVTPNP